MTKRTENTFYDFVTKDSLSPEEQKFLEEMNRQALEMCSLLGLCNQCGADLGTCVHKEEKPS